MNKIVLIIGYGSIGKKHAKLLKKFKNISKIYILTKQKCGNFNRVKSISEVSKINPDLCPTPANLPSKLIDKAVGEAPP